MMNPSGAAAIAPFAIRAPNRWSRDAANAGTSSRRVLESNDDFRSGRPRMRQLKTGIWHGRMTSPSDMPNSA
jgi:hypothetical protein